MSNYVVNGERGVLGVRLRTAPIFQLNPLREKRKKNLRAKTWGAGKEGPSFPARSSRPQLSRGHFSLSSCLQWRSKVVGTLVKTVQKITKESFGTTIVTFRGTI